MMKVLIIEDSTEVVEAVSLCFQLRWPDIVIKSTAEGNRAIELVRENGYDVVLLDIGLPDMDGFLVLQQIRSFSSVPIIILTARGREEDQARGLEIGADDYIVKPFRARDLVARVYAILRRTLLADRAREQPAVVRGRLVLHLTKNEAQLGDYSVKLTPTECMLLYVLMKNAGNTLGSQELIQQVWGREYRDTELLRTYIRRLRNRLKDNPPQIILTDHGEGYRLIPPPTQY
ncbi:MAG: response regulator transcription factor [Chloroflexi bacterium]|nr:response regulator transcription factor [Chloroflexota bacterium]